MKEAMQRLALSYEAPGLIQYRDACRRGRFTPRARRNAERQFIRFCIDVVRSIPRARWAEA